MKKMRGKLELMRYSGESWKYPKIGEGVGEGGVEEKNNLVGVNNFFFFKS